MRTTNLFRAAALAGVVIACATTYPASSEGYPARPLRLIVPFPPGGSTDIYARIIAPQLADAFHQQVVVDNRSGAGGALGAELAAKATPDGYTIWLGQTNNLVIGPILRAKNAYDPVRDFAPITLLMKAPQVMVVNVDSPLSSIRDLIAAAKKAPGKLTYGSAGVGSTGHINGELFNQSAGAEITHIPYKGASPAMIDLRGGRITYLATSLASAAQSLKEGKIKALATTGRTRARMLPDVPTVAESGVPGYELTSWHGMLAPANVSRDVILRLNKEIVAVLGKPAVQKMLLAEGGDITPSTPEEFSIFLKAEIAKWSKVIRQAGITAE
ncbi:MAG TPA: tripartite tricarboxylate transporter substrate binding protein [Burkholderiales bacterium]|nr:tripartite tricarboxylate transporter substrate binding protein [Burkholderiales bacterium]